MTRDEFNKLSECLAELFDEIDKKLDSKAESADMQRVLNILDDLSKRQEISDDKRLVMGHQLDRLNRWTHELAKKIGYKLSTS